MSREDMQHEVRSEVIGLAGEVTAVQQPQNKLVSYSYDLAGRRAVLRDPDGGRSSYTHDGAGQLTSLTSPQNGRTTFSYDLAGREVVKSLANGTRVTQVYDAAGRVTGMTTGSGGGGLLRRSTYSYDPVSRKLAMNASDRSRTTWTYDVAGQLVQEQRKASGINATHVYDPAGNRVRHIDSGTRTTYQYDVANELTQEQTNSARTTYLYDNAGNRIQKTDPAVTTYYQWDAHNRMVLAEPVSGPVTMAYNGAGQRVQKLVGGSTTQFVWDYEKLLQEADGTSGSTEQQYLATEGQYGDLVSAYGNGASRYYGFDALGSTEELLDDTGSARAKYEYRAYGLQSASGGSPGLPLAAELAAEFGTSPAPESFTWVGKQGYFWDTETGLYLLGGGGDGRLFEPASGRFLSKDPIEYQGGTPNLYEYCGNDPINCTDPSGNRIFVSPCTSALVMNAGPAYSNNVRSFAGDLLRDELVRAFWPWEGQSGQFTLPAYLQLTIGNGTYWQLKPYYNFPPDLWSKLVGRKANPGQGALADGLAGAFDVAAMKDKVLNPQKSGGGWILSWDDLPKESWFDKFVEFVFSFGGSILLGDLDSAQQQALKAVEAIAQVGLASLAQVGGVDVTELIRLLVDIGNIITDLVKHPRKVTDNLIFGALDGIEMFFEPIGRLFDNVKDGFKAWVLTRFSGLENLTKAFQKFPDNFDLKGLFQFGLSLAGLDVSSMKDLLYSSVVEAVKAKSASAASLVPRLMGLLYETVGYSPDGADDAGPSLTDVFDNLIKKLGTGIPGLSEFTNDIVDQFKSFFTDFAIKGVVNLAARLGSFATGIPVKLIYDGLKTLLEVLRNVPDFLKTFTSGVQQIVDATSRGRAAEKVVELIKDSIPIALDLAVKGLSFLVDLDLADAGKRLECIVGYIKAKIRALITNIVKALIDLFIKNKNTAKKPVCAVRCMSGNGAKSGGCAVPAAVPCGSNTKSGKGSPMAVGHCFRKATWTEVSDGLESLKVAIEEMRLGMNVPTLRAGEFGFEDSRNRASTLFDSVTERAVWLIQEKSDGYWCKVGLIRSMSWLRVHGIENAGDWTQLAMREMGVEGEYQVMSIGPCPKIEEGPGRTVTGVFQHGRGKVYDLFVEDETNPIGVTENHPFWSVDRQDWVPVSELRIGERLQANGHTVIVLRIEERGEEPVYNLEVDADHCYRVGEQGILVHNDSAVSDCEKNCQGQPIPSDNDLRQDVQAIHNQFQTDASGRPDSGERGRRTTAIAILCDPKTNKRIKVYAVSNNRTSPDVRAEAERRGYMRISGGDLIGENQSDAEQIILNYAVRNGMLKVEVDTPIAPSRRACGPERQDCAGRIANSPGVRLVNP